MIMGPIIGIVVYFIALALLVLFLYGAKGW